MRYINLHSLILRYFEPLQDVLCVKCTDRVESCGDGDSC